MADFFAPMSDIQTDVMRPIDPLLLVEDGFFTRPYQVGLGSFDVDTTLGGFDVSMMSDMGALSLNGAPTDPLIPGDVFTPTEHLFDPTGGHQPTAPRLGGFSDAMDVFNVARFLFEGR